MKSKIITLMMTLLPIGNVISTSSAQELLPYQNPALTAHERAKDLCSRLTLEEKAMLMLDDSPAIPRLGIKHWQWWSEALHGYANMGNVTNFPEPIGMAASFNDNLVYKVFDVVSTEARAKWNQLQKSGDDVLRFHALSVWTPNVNIFRDPRWGRGQETYGEDPYLTSMMGAAVVRGLQGPEESKYRKLWACAKHYAVHSGPEWSRHTADINNISARDLYETYLPAFKYCVEEAKVREVMCAYQRYDNEPCCSSTRLLQSILRDEWGFQYLVVSDCGAVTDIHSTHKVASDAVHSAARATLAGTDVECGFDYAYKSIPEAVKRSLITEEEVDRHVIRLLEGRFDLGEMDDPSIVEWSSIPETVLECKEHRQLALDIARQSITLLQNNNAILPLSKGEKIAVVGPNANDKPMMWGNYNGTPTTTSTVLDGIRAYNKRVKYVQGCDLTDDRIVTDVFDQLSFEGKKGFKGTFWNNRTREGKPVATIYHSAPFFKTTAGNYQFAPGVNLTDFSAQYETVFRPKKSGEVVINVESVSEFDVVVNGEVKVKHNTWRVTPTRTPIQVEAGKEYKIEIHFAHVPTWGASIKVNVGTESVIDYNDIIKRQLAGYDKIVFVGGIAPSLEGEEMPVNIDGFKGGDRTHIELPAVQRNFIKALKEAGKKIIFVNCSGSAIAFAPESRNCEAIVQAWYPGMEGGRAVADILYGKVNPSGKLPVTFYSSSEQLGDFEDYNMEGRTYRYIRDFKPLFPFGHGLSYTQFNIGKASLSSAVLDSEKSETVTLTVPVTNVGKREGTEVIQVYVRNPQDPAGPVKQLRGYKRVTVKPGNTAEAVLSLDAKSFEWFDENSNTVRTMAGKYELLYGNTSDASGLQSVAVEIK